MRFIHLTETDSTNEVARELARSGEFTRSGAGPIWVRADVQTAGKGRQGRVWVSDKGNLYCTGLFPRDEPLSRAPRFSFVAAIAVHETLAHFAPHADVKLKWPNDVLVSGAKISGILLETGSDYAQDWMMIGIGINVTTHPKHTPYPATHLAAHLKAGEAVPSPETVLEKLAERITHWGDVYKQQGFDAIRSKWAEQARGIGQGMSVDTGQEQCEGIFSGLGPNGELRLELADGTIRDIFAGDVTPHER